MGARAVYRPDDESLHPAAAGVASWNESVFLDWAQDERLAGHLRVGRMPGQGRGWIWLFLMQDGEWVALEAPRLPLADMKEFDYEGFGLRVRREVREPLLHGRVEATGVARVLGGPRAGRLVDVSVTLDVSAAGPPHGFGPRPAGVDASGAPCMTDRFEQPVDVRGRQRVGEREVEVAARGERDHSWGPRPWDAVTWWFLALHGPSLRLQCSRAELAAGFGLDFGYVDRGDRGARREVRAVRFAVTGDDTTAPSGTVEIVDEDGRTLAGRIEALGGTEIDAGHCLTPPRRSCYVRSLVRFHTGDGPPLLGWFEHHRPTPSLGR